MNFCPECNFLLYKNLKSNTSDGETVSKTDETYETILSPDMSHCSLVEYCKNCGYETEVTEHNVSVYKRNYQNDFIVDRILKNKYTVYDNTLPKLDIKCKNTYCITNSHSKDLSENNTIIVNNIPENLTKQEIKNILEEFTFGTETKISSPDDDYIKTINGYNMFAKRVKLCQLIVYFENSVKKRGKKKTIKTKSEDTTSTSSAGSKSSKSSKSDTSKNPVLEILTRFKDFIEDYTINITLHRSDDAISLKQFKTATFEHLHNEVIFIKYDPDNMKYIYVCVNCGDSW